MVKMSEEHKMRVSDICKTIHGELPHQGKPVVIVRLSGCSNMCSWCDAKKYRNDKGTSMEIGEIIKRVKKEALREVLVTGGEPLEQKGTVHLIRSFIKNGYSVTLETDGSFDIGRVPGRTTVVMDIKTPSSRSKRKSLASNLGFLKRGDVAKFVIADKSDYEWSKRFLRRIKGKIAAQVVFSCVDGKLEPSSLAKFLLRDNSKFRMQLQMHKILEMK